MERTKLRDRALPDYTRGEDIFNMASHAAGAAFGIFALVACLIKAAGDVWGTAGGAVYGASMIVLYSVSGVYHGLKPNMGKKVMQVLDHCCIYFLIAGTYTPILLSGIRLVSPLVCWILFAAVWGIAATAAVFTAIDHNRYAVLSMVCYLVMGWCIVFAAKPAMAAIPKEGLLYILWGGIAYTFGAILYGIGSKVRWMHSIFHLFVVAGSVLQFIGILFYVL
ncbi:MAG: hemolysin III family protein [Clostridiales bacterium]|nr:hemolysin III family protein [Clostridiales bacterium]